MIDLMLSSLAPHLCYGCGETGVPLCKSCTNDIENDDFGRCVWCLRPAANMHQCTSCATKNGVKGAWALGLREDVLLALTNGHKFEACREASASLAYLMHHALPQLDEDVMVTWVPTAAGHIRERGFDHASLLARRLAKYQQRTAQSLLIRRHSLSQHLMTRRQRELHAKTAFIARKRIDAPVLLVDDILTTGATLKGCIKALKEAGAPAVYVAVACCQPQK